MHRILPPLCLLLFAVPALCAPAAEVLEAQRELLRSMSVTAETLMPLAIDTALVREGKAAAVICHADEPAWRQAAEAIGAAVAEATGVALPLVADTDEATIPADANVILLGHLDNSPTVARLYHSFFVCLDQGYAGRTGYVLRSVHDPFGEGRNYLLVGGSFAEGTLCGAEAFCELVRQRGEEGRLSFGRLLQLQTDATDRAEPAPGPMTEKQVEDGVASARKTLFSPGQGRSGVAQLVSYAARYHRTGDPLALKAAHDMLLSLLEYYETDEVINQEGMARYDTDFRDAWTYEIAICWDLLEESEAFTDEERLDLTNLVLRLALECVLYQRYDRPDVRERWRTNEDIVHNHNTFPALGIYFAGRYFQRHYKLPAAEDWLAVARGIFNGQKHSSKPQEDAASYQWLPIIHTMIYSLAEGDPAFFAEGHAKDTARVAMMVMDNAGYQAAFGDHEALRSSSGIGQALRMIAWYHKDPQLLWGAERAGNTSARLGQLYHLPLTPVEPTGHTGLSLALLPRQCYDYAARNSQYPTAPNVPYQQTFDKLALRDGLRPEDAYLLVDGFGRGNHMHFDANAIIRFAAGGEPLLVDGEYIKNAPKYHNSLVILRDGRSELTPAVTGLSLAEQVGEVSFAGTYLTDYNGTRWDRALIWRRGGYFVVSDRVQAQVAGDYTLRCCWRPWGKASLADEKLTVEHPPMRLSIHNADGAACSLEALKQVERMDVSRLSQQVSLSLDEGDSYRFLNLISASPLEAPADRTLRRIGEATAVVTGPEGADLIVLEGQTAPVEGLSTDAALALFSADRLAVAQCTTLADRAEILAASRPVSLELDLGAGTGSLVAREATEAKLRVGAGATVAVDGKAVAVDARGYAALALQSGTHAVEVDRIAGYEAYSAAVASAAAAPTHPGRELTAAGEALAPLEPAWSHEGFSPRPEALPVASVSASRAPRRSFSPLEKLVDGAFSSSANSVQWPAGVAPVVTLTLEEEQQVSSVVLREWHMSGAWDVGLRKLEISSDGFDREIRAIEGPFVEAGTQSWGANVNTLMEVKVGQRASSLRLTLEPAREDASVYIAEVEVLGTRAGARPRIGAIATGDLTGDGVPELVVCSASGEVAALSAEGEQLWLTGIEGRPQVGALGCVDVDGDGRCEVAYGTGSARLGLLSPTGAELWTSELPRYRGGTSEVRTLTVAELDGDEHPEIVAGCKSWQFFGFDGDGRQLWRNVIYAHSATVCVADDFDGDGLDETIGGNSYYRVNLIDHDGKRLWLAPGNIGPEQTAVSSADVDGDGKAEALVATDGGDLYCYDGDGTVLWSANLGDKVTRIIPVDLTGDGVPELCCAAESANVFALKLDGSTMWRTALPDGASDLAVTGEGESLRLVAAAGAAGIALLDREGRLLGFGKVDGRPTAVAVAGEKAVAITSEGKVEAVDLR